MIDENLMEEINEAAAQGKDTLAQSAVSLQEIIDGIRAHNKWRRDGSGPLPVDTMRLGELIESACSALEKNLWHSPDTAPLDKTVMVERADGGFWWGQYDNDGWHVKFGASWLTVLDVVAWRQLPEGSGHRWLSK